jgi:hypothetical protein
MIKVIIRAFFDSVSREKGEGRREKGEGRRGAGKRRAANGARVSFRAKRRRREVEESQSSRPGGRALYRADRDSSLRSE